MLLCILLFTVWAGLLIGTSLVLQRLETGQRDPSAPLEMSPWVVRSVQVIAGVFLLLVVVAVCDGLIETDAERAAKRRESEAFWRRVDEKERARRDAQAPVAPADALGPLRAPRDRDTRDE